MAPSAFGGQFGDTQDLRHTRLTTHDLTNRVLLTKESPLNGQFLNRMMRYMFMAPAALTMAIALIYPLGFMIYTFLLDWNPAQAFGESQFIGFKNYVDLFYDPFFAKVSPLRGPSPFAGACWK